MDLTEALKDLNKTIAKALGDKTTMTATEFFTYAKAELAAAASCDEAEKTERLAALKAASSKVEQDAAAGATEFEVETYKAKSATLETPEDEESKLEKAITALVAKLDSFKPASVAVAVDGETVAKNKPTEEAKEPVVETPVVETPAVVKAAPEPCEWPRDLAAK